jgi:hypothetical protein
MFELLAALERGMGLKEGQSKLLIRVGWIIIVSVHIAWVCGWLVTFGLASPFVRAAEIAAVNGEISDIKAYQRLTLTLQLQGELRAQKSAWCVVQDSISRVSIMNRIDFLRQQLRDIAKVEDGTGDPVCPR